ncbi:4-coumarate-CoA ligase [Boeremia exigua]|uniref:4-coumarate-CoA ligase n=1 Tax=Boeremia exigua TaxID=749465 RepID=UPI001E8DF0DC|nr:4-coumarate-CoA ligase [Boeremia exigua]KAH6642754.1 4-coumarate-CoA ligase [Boeremia exigua]
MLYESPYNAGFTIPDVDITSLVLDHNLKGDVPSKPAIIDGYSGQVVYTYGSLRDKIRLFAGFLQKDLNIAPGDVVAYLSYNTTYYPIIIHGLLAAGAVVSAFNPAYTAEELCHTLTLAKPKYVLVQSELLDSLEKALGLIDGLFTPKLHVLDGKHQVHPSYSVLDILARDEYASYFQRYHRSPKQVASDVALICFSSGTSGLVKGVQLTHGNVVANVTQQGRCLDSMYQPDTVFTLVVPFFHILGLGGFCIQYLCHGAPIVVFRSFDLPKMLESIRRDKVTHVNVVPPIAMAILRSPLTANADFSSVRCLMNAAAPLKPELADELSKRMGCVLTQWYGCTEASPSIISQREDETHIRGTVGRLLPNMQMRVVDAQGADVERGTPGELWIRGPNIMRGYVQHSATTEDGFRDGFFPTGDVGYVDDQGFVYLVDRLKELIKVKGNQVAPAELEALLLTHPDVTDAAVCGVTVEEEGTEYPVGYITTDWARDSHAALIETLREYVEKRVAHYKRLVGGIHVLDAIPRNPSGKVLRRRLPVKEDKAVAEAIALKITSQRRSKL